MYGLWILIGIFAALAASRLGPRDGRALPPWLRLAAVLGAVLGAHLLHLPAAWLDGLPPHENGTTWGRTVLGGLLGGWWAVELGKRCIGHRQPTGDAFALPLAIALACGRLGCLSAGCCAGAPCPPGWWATSDAAGVTRWPVQLIEVGFHALAAIPLAIAWRRGWQRHRLLAWYLLAYGILRFVLEEVRLHPTVLGPLTWYQLLALALILQAGLTCWRRRTGRPNVTPSSSMPTDNLDPGRSHSHA